MDTFTYQGQELDLFAHARNWKQYWSSRVGQWIEGDVIEVGAGIGVNTALLQNPRVRTWHCLEPDPNLARRLTEAVAGIPGCSSSTGMIDSLAGRQFDSILYIDVLEHIEADRDELRRAAELLRPGGHVIVLSPAHQFLFSPFDAAIGHYRRYNKASLSACSPESCALESMFYLDFFGMALSVANRLLLRQSSPTLQQIQTWDRYIVPASRMLDGVVGWTGKTIVGVWRRK
jgi:hypothetical protein